MSKIVVNSPMSEEDVRKFKAGDIVYITGRMVTARDHAHKMTIETVEKGQKLPIDFNGLAVYHCGPVVKKEGDEWKFVSAGPTTSTRLEIQEDIFIEKVRARAFIGKGGMGPRTVAACQKYGAMYLLFTGGAGAAAASFVKKVENVHWLDKLGIPEALWVLDVVEFGPLTVSIDAHGNNLYAERYEKVKANRKKALEILGV